MIKTFLFVFWFFLPVGFSNIAAFLSAKIPYIRSFTYPIDFYMTYRNKRVLGDHKTIRGLIAGVVIGITTVYFQIYAYNHVHFIRSFSSIHYNTINPWIFGVLAGLGEITGDAIKSFFKRQLNIPPGKSWFPFDQSDYIIGGIFFTSFYILLTFQEYLLLFFVWFFLHPVFNLIGYVLKLKKEKL